MGVLGEPTSIFCELGIGNTSDIFLWLNGVNLRDSGRLTTGITNDTHKEFILNPTQGRDSGAEISCSIEEIDSLTVTFTPRGEHCN